LRYVGGQPAALDPAFIDSAGDVEKIFHDEYSVRRLIGRFPDPGRLSVCYEAGPTGYDLHRLLKSIGVRCEVIALATADKLRTASAWVVAQLADIDHLVTDGSDELTRPYATAGIDVVAV